MSVITCIVQNKVPLLNQMKHAIYWLKDSNRNNSYCHGYY